MKQQTKIRVLLADDNPFVLEGIKSCLSAQNQIEIVAEASNSTETLQKAEAFRPDVVIASLAMYEMNAFDVARHFRRVAPKAKLLILPMDDSEKFIGQMIKCGAVGCIRKTSSAEDLVHAIERVHRGETFFEPKDAQLFLEKYVKGRPERVEQLQNRSLSPREREVLISIGQGLANKEIAERLHLSVRTVEKHRQRMMNKLGIHKATELVKFAITQGLVPLKMLATDVSFRRAEPQSATSEWQNARTAC
jgi:DNA-binding NarL/FixJ family response regulator